MTDTTKTRTPREMPPGTAIAKLRALGTLTDYVDAAVAEAAAKRRAEAVEEYGKQVARILERVHPAAKYGVMTEAGIAVLKEPADAQSDDAPESEVAELPRGAQPYTESAVAKAARGGR